MRDQADDARNQPEEPQERREGDEDGVRVLVSLHPLIVVAALIREIVVVVPDASAALVQTVLLSSSVVGCDDPQYHDQRRAELRDESRSLPSR